MCTYSRRIIFFNAAIFCALLSPSAVCFAQTQIIARHSFLKLAHLQWRRKIIPSHPYRRPAFICNIGQGIFLVDIALHQIWQSTDNIGLRGIEHQSFIRPRRGNPEHSGGHLLHHGQVQRCRRRELQHNGAHVHGHLGFGHSDIRQSQLERG